MSSFPQLELFLESVKAELLNPAIVCSIPDNLTISERQALSRLKHLDRQVIKIQDKGSKFVVLDKEEYSANIFG